MSHEAEGNADPVKNDTPLDGAIDQAMNLQSALRGLNNSAEHWRSIGDLEPYSEAFRNFGMSALLELADALPEYRRFGEWLPRNWRDKPHLDLGAALEVINEGIPLIWVPNAGTVSDLLYSKNPNARSRILADRHAGIGDLCLTALGEVQDPELAPLAEFAGEAAEALVDSRFSSAQALASNVLDTWIRDAAERGVFGDSGRWSGYREVKTQIRPLANDTPLEWFREICVLVPLAVALSDYMPGDPTPSIFNRHATAHRVGQEQYTPANSVISVMLITSVLREAEESGL